MISKCTHVCIGEVAQNESGQMQSPKQQQLRSPSVR